MTRRTTLSAEYQNNCGPVGRGFPAKTFTDQLKREIGDNGDLVAFRFPLSDNGVERVPSPGIPHYDEDPAVRQIVYHGTRLELLTAFLTDGKIKESTGIRTKGYLDGFYTMRANMTRTAVAYAVMSPVFTNRYAMGAVYEGEAVPQDRQGNRTSAGNQYPFAAKDIRITAVILVAFSMDGVPDSLGLTRRNVGTPD